MLCMLSRYALFCDEKKGQRLFSEAGDKASVYAGHRTGGLIFLVGKWSMLFRCVSSLRSLIFLSKETMISEQ